VSMNMNVFIAVSTNAVSRTGRSKANERTFGNWRRRIAPMTKTPNEWRERLRRFAEAECRGLSRLYEVVSLGSADDGELVEWIASVAGPRADPTTLLAAVHDRLLAGANGGGLAAFYPNLTAQPAAPDAAYPAFRAFVMAHRDALAQLLAERTTQTNEVNRCSYLLPAFVFAGVRTNRPLAIIDVGASAGLNLLFDRYAYDYGDGARAGDPSSAVRVTTQLRGVRPRLAPLPAIANRCGVDLSPVALDDADATRWLEACVWPEHVERFERLRAALAVARDAKPRVVAGNAVELLPALVAQVDRNAAIVVVNTNVMVYFSKNECVEYGRVLRDSASQRELFWIANEHPALLRWAGFAKPIAAPSDTASLPLSITHFHQGARDEFVVADVGAHGRWLDWFGEGS
jgi:hypothetical protein